VSEKDDEKELPQSKQGVIVPLDVRCGQCYHFAKERATRYSDVCSKLGVLPLGRPCVAYLANVNSMSLHTDEGKTFAEILDKIPTSKLTAFAALINQERTTRRFGFRHGQQVYVRIFPDEYISNYVKVWIMLVSKNRVLVQGVKTDFRGSFLKTSILTQEQFEVKRKALRARRRIIDPKINQYTTWRPKIVPKAVAEYEPPTIDNVPKDMRRPLPPKNALSLEVIKFGGNKHGK
jgi:hypothetical protein